MIPRRLAAAPAANPLLMGVSALSITAFRVRRYRPARPDSLESASSVGARMVATRPTIRHAKGYESWPINMQSVTGHPRSPPASWNIVRQSQANHFVWNAYFSPPSRHHSYPLRSMPCHQRANFLTNVYLLSDNPFATQPFT